MPSLSDFRFRFLLVLIVLLAGCGSGGGSTSTGATTPQAAAPTISTTAAQGGAVIVSLASTTSGATIYYTVDGSTPTTSSQIYEAPFLVASNLTVNAMATASGDTKSSVATQAFSPNIPSGTLVWSDEFSNTGTANVLPSATNWTYDIGTDCCGNDDQETYCAAGSSTSPCNPSNPNAYIAPGGGLNIVAENPSNGVYTSARLKSQGLFSFQYGRIEAKMTLPESQGMWPAFWLLGNNIATINWPACGELDIMEHIDGSNPPPYAGGTPEGYDWIAGSVHGGASSNEENESQQYHPTGFSAAASHTYGMIWTKGQIQYYVDSQTNVYATFNSTDSTWAPTPWPFDAGPQFIILDLAVGGDWPGDVNVGSPTVFPSTMQVQYVRIYTN
ncbi:MAG: chitobiase/beta-hexosaminidase C-terminal domain-containing protein [Terracidiphilus sp.]